MIFQEIGVAISTATSRRQHKSCRNGGRSGSSVVSVLGRHDPH
jgi:hypothetical protein